MINGGKRLLQDNTDYFLSINDSAVHSKYTIEGSYQNQNQNQNSNSEDRKGEKKKVLNKAEGTGCKIRQTWIFTITLFFSIFFWSKEVPPRYDALK